MKHLNIWVSALTYMTILVTLVSILIFIIISVKPAFPFSVPLAFRPVGMFLIFVGGLLAIWSYNLFVKIGKGTPAFYNPPKKFVITGPYKYVRNPMYIAGLSIILGLSFILQNSNLLVATFGFWLILHLFVLVFEEPQLERRFGKDYIEYKKRVPRWMPKIRNKL